MSTLLLVMRHGSAEAPGAEGDAARRLSPEGREKTRRAAAVLAGIVPRPRRIYSSPLVRARETAQCLADAFGLEEMVPTPLLAPGFDYARIAAELARSGNGPVAIVGHEPDLSGFVAWQIGAGTGVRVKLGKGAACLITLARPGEAVLHALYPLDALVGMAPAQSRPLR